MSTWGSGHRIGAMTPVEIRLRDARKAAGLTQAELAAKTGIDQGDLSRIENGKTGGMSLDVLDRLCKALKCQPGDMLVRKRR